MALKNNNDNEKIKILSLDKLKKLVTDIKYYNTQCDIVLQTNINENKALIDEEIERAKLAEAEVKTYVEEVIDVKIEELDKNSDNTNLNNEKRFGEIEGNILSQSERINNLTQKHNDDISNLDANLKTYTDNKVLLSETSLNTNIANAKNDLTSIINAKTSELNNNINLNKTDIALNKNNLTSHVLNFSNPHNITTAQIGAANQTDFVALSGRVTNNENEISDIKSDLNNIDSEITNTINTNLKDINDSIDNIENTLEDLNKNKLNNIGLLEVTGSLKIEDGQGHSGDLNVAGTTTTSNLIVTGSLEAQEVKTTSITNETLEVKDNFITINSDGTKIENVLSGIAIKTNPEGDAYGISYDPTNDSVSLGVGIIDENNNFQFKSGEDKPILTRSQSDKLEDGHILVWDAENNIAKDGGEFNVEQLTNTFATWDAHNAAVSSISKNIGNVEENIDSINENIDNIEEDIIDYKSKNDEKVATLETTLNTIDNTKLNITDNGLNTDNKTIVGAINEIDINLNSHESRTDNPHTVVWDQVHTSGAFDDNILPSMDGGDVGTVGESTKVARADHKHPIDTSRAPVNHASESNEYGIATDKKYGHVKFDTSIESNSENAVLGKTIYSHVLSKINDLDSSLTTKINNAIANIDVVGDGTSLNLSETIKSITEKDGIITFTKLSIQIGQNLVNGLQDSLTGIGNRIDTIVNTTIPNITKSITDELVARSQADVLLGESITTTNKNLDNLTKELTTTNDNLDKVEEKVDKNTEDISTLNTTVNNINLLDNAVKLSESYRFTEQFGKYVPSDTTGYVDVGTEGMTLRDFFLDAFQVTSTGTIEQPNYSFTISGSSNGEIGATYNAPVATFKVTSVGNYPYGPSDTNVRYSVKIAGGGNAETVENTSLGKNESIQLTASEDGIYGNESKTYSFTATYSHTEGDVPKTNINTTDESKKIASLGETELPIEKIFNAGWREGCFYGTISTDGGVTDDAVPTGWVIRNLQKRLNASYSAKTDLTYQVPIGATAIIIACPEGTVGPTSVYNATVNAEMISNFKKKQVTVGGADATSDNVGDYAETYNIWYYTPAEAYKSIADLKIDLG